MDAPNEFKTRETLRKLRQQEEDHAEEEERLAKEKIAAALKFAAPKKQKSGRFKNTAALVMGVISIEQMATEKKRLEKERDEWQLKTCGGVKMWIHTKTREIREWHNPPAAVQAARDQSQTKTSRRGSIVRETGDGGRSPERRVNFNNHGRRNSALLRSSLCRRRSNDYSTPSGNSSPARGKLPVISSSSRPQSKGVTFGSSPLRARRRSSAMTTIPVEGDGTACLIYDRAPVEELFDYLERCR